LRDELLDPFGERRRDRGSRLGKGGRRKGDVREAGEMSFEVHLGSETDGEAKLGKLKDGEEIVGGGAVDVRLGKATCSGGKGTGV
jgi:hypothetical protein